MSTAVLEQQVRAATTLWEVVVALLRHWHNRPPDHQLAHDQIGDPYSQWTRLEEAGETYFGGRTDGRILGGDADQIIDWTDGGDFDSVHAVAWAIDAVASPTFVDDWRRTLSLVDGCADLHVGDLYPVGVLLRGDIPRHHRFSTRPSAATQPAPDELPSVRVHRRNELRPLDVTFDFRHETRLKAIFANLRELATIHPNATSDEFERSTGQLLFPVRVVDQAAQLERFMKLVHLACFNDFEPQMMVAPELAATDAIVEAVSVELADAGRPDCLVVAGSQHVGAGHSAANRAYALLNEEDPITHDKIIPFRRRAWSGREQKEGIAPRSQLTIFAAGRFRFSLLVCKDFLDTEIQQLLGRLGVNVVAVPAMSAKTDRFVGGSERMVDLSQSFVVVSNGPYVWRGQESADPAAVFAEPIHRFKVAAVSPEGRHQTGFAWFEVGSQRGHWHGVDFDQL